MAGFYFWDPCNLYLCRKEQEAITIPNKWSCKWFQQMWPEEKIDTCVNFKKSYYSSKICWDGKYDGGNCADVLRSNKYKACVYFYLQMNADEKGRLGCGTPELCEGYAQSRNYRKYPHTSDAGKAFDYYKCKDLDTFTCKNANQDVCNSRMSVSYTHLTLPTILLV